jgi:uncharacterized protein (TIGR00369 family)
MVLMLRFPLGEFLGFEYFPTADGYEIEFQPQPQHLNPRGTLHGGVLCDLTDAAMGLTWMQRVGEDKSFTTIELKINYLKPVWDSRLRAIPRILKGGRTIALLACDVFDQKGSLVAHATSTVMMLDGEAAKGR